MIFWTAGEVGDTQRNFAYFNVYFSYFNSPGVELEKF